MRFKFANGGVLPREVFLNAVRFGCVIAIAVSISLAIDPYIGIHSSFPAIFVNSVLPVFLVFLLCALTGRAWMAFLMEALLLGLLCYADQVKMAYLSSNLVYADLTVAGDLLKDPKLVLGFIHLSSMQVVTGFVVLLGVSFISWYLYKIHVFRLPVLVNKAVRYSCLLFALIGFWVVGWHRVPNSIDKLHWEVFSQLYAGKKVGVSGNVLLGKMTARSFNRKPNSAAVESFWKDPLVKNAVLFSKSEIGRINPDIIVLQSESLFEPSSLCGFPDTPLLKHAASQRLGGVLHVPVFGGRTLQTEFEVQSGVPVDAFPGSMFAYYDLVRQPFAALPHVLGAQGYRTIAIHPGNRGFWRRSKAMGDMGFDAFEGIGAFLYPRDFSDRGHVRDAALVRAVLAELDSADRPTYVTAITMDNHFPYGGVGAPANDTALGLPSVLSNDARRELSDYLVHAIDADNAYGFLIDALKRRNRPTLVIFYGDHLPPLGHVYKELCFKDKKRPEMHSPPFSVWANFSLPDAPSEMYSYLLPGWVMRAAGLPLEGAMLANSATGIIVSNPSLGKEDRQRIVNGYTNIAVAGLNRKVDLPVARGHVFVARKYAASTLMGLANSKDIVGIVDRYNDLYFSKPGGGEIEFAINGGVSSISLRPYMGAPILQCMRANNSSAEFSVEADGELLYRAKITDQSVRLVTLDLHGVKNLKFLAKGGGDDVCSQPYVRVARMRCYSAHCDSNRLEAAESAGGRRAASRILEADHISGDVKALSMLVPEAVRLAGEDRPAMSWLMTQEIARQDGFSPITLEHDYRLFMPPPDTQSAWIDFRVKSIEEITFSPRIKPLTPECKALNAPGKEGGVAGLTLLLDGEPVASRKIVDRNYRGAITVKTGDAQTLRVVVDKGNDVSWCDWFSIGVDEMKVKGTADTSGARLVDVTASYRAIP